MERLFITLAALFLLVPALFIAGAQRGGGAQPAANPPDPVFWSAQHIKELGDAMKARVDPNTHNAGMALIPSANLIYREGDSGSEVHEKLAEIIFVHEGEGAIQVGGKMIGGKQDRPDELRGTSIEGGTRYAIAKGDSIYIPANMPHQFFVEKGKHFMITIVKLPPQP